MYSVLIVDDEILAIQFLSKLIDWESYHCRIVGTALTQGKALALVEQHRPDIIFMDIRMPDTDGIQLSEKILKMHPLCSIVILTAYQEFEHARAALRLGISRFLLKHELDAVQFVPILQDVLRNLEKRRQMRSVVLKKWIADTLLGSQEPVPNTVALTEGTQYALCLVKPRGLCALFPLGDSIRWKPQGERSAYFCREGFSMFEFEALPNGVYCFLYEMVPIASRMRTQEILADAASALLRMADAELPWGGMVIVEGPFKHLWQLGQAAAGVADCDVLLQRCNVLSKAEYCAIPQVSPAFPARYASRVIEEMHLRSPALEQAFFKPFANLPHQGRCTLEDLAPLAELLGELGQMRTRLRLSSYRELWEGGKLPPEGFHSLGTLLRWVWLDMKALLHVESSLYSKSRALAADAAQYIDHCYARDLTAAEIAKRLHVSSGHLRSLFKQEYGCTLNDYLLKVRIAQAKELLLAREKKIYAIATLCGFKTSQHFSAVFKAEVGVSPVKFRNGSDENEDCTKNG